MDKTQPTPKYMPGSREVGKGKSLAGWPNPSGHEQKSGGALVVIEVVLDFVSIPLPKLWDGILNEMLRRIE